MRGKPFEGTSLDISTTGVRIRLVSSHDFQIHDLYRLEIELPQQSNPIVTSARVARAEEMGPAQWQLALQFDVINPDDQYRIRDLGKDLRKPIDRRVEPRLSSCINASIYVLGSATPAFTKDISASGIRIRVATPCRFQIGENYRVAIDLPKLDGTLRAVGRVARIIQEADASDEWEIALELIDMSDDDKSRLREYIHRRETERKELDLD